MRYCTDLQKSITECFYCGKDMCKKSTSREHIVPHSLGGVCGAINIVLVHSKCNNIRGNKTLQELYSNPPKDFMRERIADLIRHHNKHLNQLYRKGGKIMIERIDISLPVKHSPPFSRMRISVVGKQFYIKRHGISPYFHEE